MFVPGHNEKLLGSAAHSSADALILDIEDSVMPDFNKQVARDRIAHKVNSGLFGSKPVFPRINDRESGHLLRDVMSLAIEGVAGFVYPKAKRGEDVYFFGKLLETIEYERNFPIGTFKIVPLIETTAAVLNAQDICSASGRVIAVAYGCEDFLADLGGACDSEKRNLFTPRAMIAMAAKAAGVIPVDTVHTDVHNLEDLEESLKLARVLGFEGMLVLHPKELPIVHRYFTPNEEEVGEARQMLRLYEEASRAGKGVAILEGKFIGPPMVIAARKILERHALIEQRGRAV